MKIGEDVEKKRVSKSYRHPELDDRIRRHRNRREAELIRQASRAGANVPQVLEEGEHSLKLERIDGKPLKDVLEESHCRALGENLAKIHEADVIHGDLTTSNAIATDEGEVYLIDFGLSFRSERIEDRAMDLHMFRQILRSSHPDREDKCWDSFVEGYRDYEKSEEVLSRLEEVESRGRYKT